MFSKSLLSRRLSCQLQKRYGFELNDFQHDVLVASANTTAESLQQSRSYFSRKAAFLVAICNSDLKLLQYKCPYPKPKPGIFKQSAILASRRSILNGRRVVQINSAFVITEMSATSSWMYRSLQCVLLTHCFR